MVSATAKGLIGRALVLLLPALLGGCISFWTPGDLTFVSAEAVDYYDRPEMPRSMSDVLVGSGMIQPGAAGQLPDGADQDLPPKRHELMLKVTFTSRMDLLAYVRDNGYPLGASSYFCGAGWPNKLEPWRTSSVYWNGRNVSSIDRAALREGQGDETTPITYAVFLRAAQEADPTSIPVKVAFDLRQMPRDLCFQLSGGNGGFGYRSNEVVVPAAAVAAAMKTLPPAFRGGGVTPP